jgi:hypothetical protein
MSLGRSTAFAAMLLALAAASMADGDAGRLRLVLLPRHVRLAEGTFSLDRPLVLSAAGSAASLPTGQLCAEHRDMVKYLERASVRPHVPSSLPPAHP